MPARILTDDQKLRIAELREHKGLSTAVIARLVKTSKGSVDWYCLIQGVEPPGGALRALGSVPAAPVIHTRGGFQVRRFTQAEDLELLALEAEGLSRYAIGRRLGRPANSIQGRLATLARRQARAEARAAAGLEGSC